jgi:hypothetical protein
LAYLSEVVPVVPYFGLEATTYNDSVSIVGGPILPIEIDRLAIAGLIPYNDSRLTRLLRFA